MKGYVNIMKHISSPLTGKAMQSMVIELLVEGFQAATALMPNTGRQAFQRREGCVLTKSGPFHYSVLLTTKNR